MRIITTAGHYTVNTEGDLIALLFAVDVWRHREAFEGLFNRSAVADDRRVTALLSVPTQLAQLSAILGPKLFERAPWR